MGRAVSRAIKRSIDIVGAVVGLILLSPVLAGASVAVYASLGRPILFCQERAGLHGAPFRMCKFRTMRPVRDGEVWFRSDEQRLTRAGRWLRRTSIDELPELWLVLRGKMSLVGPRPLLPEYLPLYTAEQARRHDVRPGITGWAQVRGRQMIPFSKRLELDVWYVDHVGLRLDLRILLMTMRDVVGTRGVLPGQNIDEIDDLGFGARALTPAEGETGPGTHAP